MDWTTFAQLWGPAVPVFGILVFFLHRLVFKTIPRGFRTMRTAAEKAEQEADARHRRHLRMLRRVEAACGKCGRRRTPAKKKPTRERRG